MGDMGIQLPSLNSDQSSTRLRAISSLRKRGLGERVSLPQIIVCGDQSCGKSSVLQGISTFPFPRQNGLCMRFATEIILEDSPGDVEISVSLIPHSSRNQECKERMFKFARNIETFDELPDIIAEAGSLMGLKGFSDSLSGPAFARDVLQIRMSGPTGLHLSVVDLPGIIQNPSEDQTDADVNAVHELVDSYMLNPRSIILAVVQAGNDISNQPVIRKCKKFDPSGQRTIGIITKPDLINHGTEDTIACLARNEGSTRLKLGFFLVKNPAPEDIKREMSFAARESWEQQYLDNSPWKNQDLNRDRVGTSKLKSYLQDLLDRHIEAELPKVRDELRAWEKETREKITRLGEARQTTADMRMHLSRLATKFGSICCSALQGGYSQSEFFDRSNEKVSSSRLRASIHALNIKFSDELRTNGARRKIVAHLGIESDASDDESSIDASG